MSSSVGKRLREQQKKERALAKAERRAARLAADPEDVSSSPIQSEAELIAELEAVHKAAEAGDIALEEFEERRLRIQANFERLLQ